MGDDSLFGWRARVTSAETLVNIETVVGIVGIGLKSGRTSGHTPIRALSINTQLLALTHRFLLQLGIQALIQICVLYLSSL